MKGYKIVLFISLVLSFLVSCSFAQKKEDNEKQPMMNNKINAANFVEELTKKIKHYDEEPRYFLRVGHSNCVYEILVNGILTKKQYTIENLASPISLDYEILQSGAQTVTVRMYPLGDAVKRAYDQGDTVTELLAKSSVDIKVAYYKNFRLYHGLEDEVIIKSHTSPTKPNTDNFVGAGLPYYEYSFTFMAKVPYKLEGWTKGQDLRKLDQKELEKQVKLYYKKVQKIYLEEDKDALARLLFNDYLLVCQAKYENKEKIQRIWDECLEEIAYREKEFGDLDDCLLKFYGNGRLVSLKHPSHEPVDYRLRGKSAFWFKYRDRDGELSAFFPNVDLYLPEGEPLENIRVLD